MSILESIISGIFREEAVFFMFPSAHGRESTGLISFPDMEKRLDKLAEDKCYQAVCRIYNIIEDEQLNDEDCFRKIEGIICTLESIGIGIGRHDL